MLQTPVMSVQLNFRIYDTVEQFSETIHRFVDLARGQEAKLVVFPELTGMLLVPPLMSGMKSNLLRSAGQGRQVGSSLLQKVRGLLAGSVAEVMRADIRGETLAWLRQPDNIGLLQQTYHEIFSIVARDHRVTVVAGSIYRPSSSSTSACHNTSYVFGSDGSLLGAQDQVHLHGPRFGEVCAGDRFEPIETPMGILGVLVGSDALFPEAARTLAYEGAEVLVNPAAAAGELAAAKLRHAFEARVLENETYGIQSFMVGKNPWAIHSRDEFFGRSMVSGPMEITARAAGIMTEMGTPVEGIIVEVLDLTALHSLWNAGAASLRTSMRPGVYSQPLGGYYVRGQTIQDAREARKVEAEKPRVAMPPTAPAPRRAEPEAIPMIDVSPSLGWREGAEFDPHTEQASAKNDVNPRDHVSEEEPLAWEAEEKAPPGPAPEVETPTLDVAEEVRSSTTERTTEETREWADTLSWGADQSTEVGEDEEQGEGGQRSCPPDELGPPSSDEDERMMLWD